jgi:putative hydrolase of the HAD superfamily
MEPQGDRERIRGVFFDFGGVIAREGYRRGLHAIAEKNGREPESFFARVEEIMRETGYEVGRSGEADFWERVRRELDIPGRDEELRREILSRFEVREWVVAAAVSLKRAGLALGILSDQTNWLDELDAEYGFMRHFDPVINSFHNGRTKRDPGLFDQAAGKMGLPPAAILFIDDKEGHVERARSRGMAALLFDFDRPGPFLQALGERCPELEVEELAARFAAGEESS